MREGEKYSKWYLGPVCYKRNFVIELPVLVRGPTVSTSPILAKEGSFRFRKI